MIMSIHHGNIIFIKSHVMPVSTDHAGGGVVELWLVGWGGSWLVAPEVAPLPLTDCCNFWRGGADMQGLASRPCSASCTKCQSFCGAGTGWVRCCLDERPCWAV